MASPERGLTRAGSWIEHSSNVGAWRKVASLGGQSYLEFSFIPQPAQVSPFAGTLLSCVTSCWGLTPMTL